jgi:hypothetical protein
MENLVIEGSAKTPVVNFNASTGILEISGRSIPENSVEFYKPMVDWIEAYGAAPQAKTELLFKLEYFNTSSSKCILDLFRKLEKLFQAGNNTVIKWYYDEDDEDMQESGEDFKAIMSVPIEMIIMD